MSEFVADASAVLAFVKGEEGEKHVARVRESCVVASPNLMEAFSKLIRHQMSAEHVTVFLREAFPRVVPLDRELAETSAVLHAATRKLNLSYADCVCLCLGNQRKATVLTADHNWAEVDLDVKVELIR
ncbi:MAG TPA: PIN domain-containing protein [Pirellulales bacterium]|nr:PIN domain-containing protein [Pirellulales bacterium]